MPIQKRVFIKMFPAFCGMALVASRAELPVMGVVLLVAVNAALAGLGHGFAGWRCLGVTRLTLHRGMGARKRVAGLPGVVEIPGFPVTGVVTALAPGAQTGFVLVVFSVAGDAFALCILEAFCYMAVFAFDASVAAG